MITLTMRRNIEDLIQALFDFMTCVNLCTVYESLHVGVCIYFRVSNAFVVKFSLVIY